MQIFIKDPDAVLDYEIDWSPWLGTDTILSSTWVVSGITQESISNTNTTTTITVSGGTVGTQASATNHITTTGGYQDDRTLYFTISDK